MVREGKKTGIIKRKRSGEARKMNRGPGQKTSLRKKKMMIKGKEVKGKRTIRKEATETKIKARIEIGREGSFVFCILRFK